MTTRELSAAAAAWFLDRGIEPETAAHCGVYTTARGRGGAEVIVFPFVERGVEVNEKVRTYDKRFWQAAGKRKTFWNHDALLDPALRRDGGARLVITEGEVDAITAIQCGFPLTVSVPDGAPQQAGEGPVDPADDAKFAYVWNCWDALKEVRQIVLAVDSDSAGKALAAELVRRLSVDRCFFVTYPEDCKDLNDVLARHGEAAVVRVLNDARPYPVKGLYRLADFPDRPEPQGLSTGIPGLDWHFKPIRGGFFVVTGRPGHGKSTLMSAIACNMATTHHWRWCVASFEMPPVPFHRDAMRAYSLQRPAWAWGAGDAANADAWIDKHFVFIAQTPRHDDELDLDIDEVLSLAGTAVVRYGIDGLVLDPWNEIEHRRRRDESESDYIGRAIRQVKRFAQRHDVAVFVVAHPTKPPPGSTAKPSLYDIAGSAHWYNKADAGLVVYRPEVTGAEVELVVPKTRFRSIGKPGMCRVRMDEQTGHYSAPDAA